MDSLPPSYHQSDSTENPPVGHHESGQTPTPASTASLLRDDIENIGLGERRQRESGDYTKPCKWGRDCRFLESCVFRHNCKWLFNKCKDKQCKLFHVDRNGEPTDKPAGRTKRTLQPIAGERPGVPNTGVGGPSTDGIRPPVGGGLRGDLPNPPSRQNEREQAVLPPVGPPPPITHIQASQLDIDQSDEVTIKAATEVLRAGKDWAEAVRRPPQDPYFDLTVKQIPNTNYVFGLSVTGFMVVLQWAFISVIAYFAAINWQYVKYERCVDLEDAVGHLLLPKGTDEDFDPIPPYCWNIYDSGPAVWLTPMFFKWVIWSYFVWISAVCLWCLEAYLWNSYKNNPRNYFGLEQRQGGCWIEQLPVNCHGQNYAYGFEWLRDPDIMSAHMQLPIGLCYLLSTKITPCHTAGSQYPTVGSHVRNWCRENKISAEDTAFYINVATHYLRPEKEVWPKISTI
jgi:hypothetical protein